MATLINRNCWFDAGGSIMRGVVKEHIIDLNTCVVASPTIGGRTQDWTVSSRDVFFNLRDVVLHCEKMSESWANSADVWKEKYE